MRCQGNDIINNANCKREAIIFVGSKNNWMLCGSCANLPEFVNFKKQLITEDYNPSNVIQK